MRIISGTYRGRHIPVPASFRARPTTDFAKEGLFNVLANIYDFEGLAVLDLFAGTGSIGFEFASRGAARVDMVEINAATFRFLHRTTSTLGMKNIRIYRAEALKFISDCYSKFDIVFGDPPYQLEIIPEIPDHIFEAEILEAEGWFILEHGKAQSFSNHPRFLEMRKYGSVRFSIFQ